MSKIALTPDASGTGTFTIAAPNSNTNRTLTLPDEAGEMLTDARLASQAEAQAGTDNTRLMTALRTAEAIAALSAYPYKNFELFTASGTWTHPPGVTEVFAIVVGAGGGGGAGSSGNAGGNGGLGGLGAGLSAVSGNVTVTIGAGGAGSNSGTGGGGGTSSFNGISATGGTGGGAFSGSSAPQGVDGNSTTAPIRGRTVISDTLFYFATINSTLINIFGVDTSLSRARGSGIGGAVYVPGNGAAYGSRGLGESSGTGNNASGGMNGAVLVFW
jgi:hypothetical protein